MSCRVVRFSPLHQHMLRASLFRLPFIVTFLTAAALGIVLELLSFSYYSVPDVYSSTSHFAFNKLHKYNASRRIASQMWHFHNVVGLHLYLIIMEECIIMSISWLINTCAGHSITV